MFGIYEEMLADPISQYKSNPNFVRFSRFFANLGCMTRRGAYAKGVAKREEILEAALGVIARDGIRGASVREIADAAGLSAAGLLHYFDSKEELFVEILRARDERDTREYVNEDFIGAFLQVVRHNADVPGLVRLYAQMAAEAGDPEHPARAYFRGRTDAVESVARDAVRAAQAAGELRSDVDPAWVVRSVHALADGLQTAWLLDSSVDMTADIETFLALLRP